MTVKELYEWAKENNAEDLEIVTSHWGDFSGSFEVEEDVTPDVRTIESAWDENGHILEDCIREVTVVCLG